MRTGRNPAILASLAVLASGLILLRIYDTPAGSSLLFLAYLAAWVILPGWLVYLLLARQAGGAIRQLAFGWSLGYILSIFGFMFTAAIDARDLFNFYPLIIGLPVGAALLLRRRTPGPSAAEPPTVKVRGGIGSELGWAIAGVCVLAMAYVGISFFGMTPLPGTETISYFQDFPWTIALAADALHHWPMLEPAVSGEPMPYHNFVHLHFASVSQVTGIGLPEVFFRLWILPVVVLMVLQFVEGGRSLFGNPAIGLLAAALTFFVGDAGLFSGGVLFSFFILSPTFIFGVVTTIPLLILIGERFRSNSLEATPGSWVLLALFAAGCGGAKVSILPLLIGAVAIFGLYLWVRQRKFPVVVLAVGLILSAAQIAYYLLLYRGHSSGLELSPTAGIDFLNSIAATDFVKAAALDILPGIPGLDALLSVIAVPLAFIALLGPPLVGLFWFLRRDNRPFPVESKWLLAVFTLGIVFLLVTEAPGSGNQLYFVYYGFMAGIMLSAVGIGIAWSDRAPIMENRRPVLALLGLWVLVLVAFVVLPDRLAPDDLGKSLLIGSSMLVAGILAIWLLARHFLAGVRGGVAVVVASAFLMTGFVDAPRNYLDPALSSKSPPTTGYRMTPDMFNALDWMRRNTSEDAVFIVNKQFTENVTGFATAYDYPAFSERRAWLAGWGYSNRARDTGYDKVFAGFNPFADRKALNDAAFLGDPEAIKVLVRDHGVRYAVLDEVNGDPADLEAMKRFGEVVYSAPGVTVLEFKDVG